MFKVVSVTIVLGALVTPAGAAQLPLKAGTYVNVEYACVDAGEATSISYLGGMFHSAGATTSLEKIIKHIGSTYTLRYTLIDNVTGTSEDLEKTITVLNRTKFSLVSEFGSGTYRWCSSGWR
jgi:hypothetical protein